MVKIIIDAFGGDNSPSEVIKGAIQAVLKNDDMHVVLCGKEDIIQQELAKYKYNANQISILNAKDVITNDDSPATAIRTKKNSSIVIAYDYLKEHEDCVGFISAGSTGAVLTGGFLKVGRLKGIHRPALCPILPTVNGSFTVICDAGANMDCKPEYLDQFAIMGSVYTEVLGKKKPRVALLNVGIEDHKGDTLSKDVFALLNENKNINFVGNMEARDLLSGEYDVIVADGFAGNVLLKSTEGAIKNLLKVMKTEIKSSFLSKIGAVFMSKTFKGIKKNFDYTSFGGAVLLGCKKIVVKAHGTGKADNFSACLNQVYSMHNGKLLSKIAKKLDKMSIVDEQ